ncbi:MAG: cytochrome c3 family protein [Woeseia sp.]
MKTLHTHGCRFFWILAVLLTGVPASADISTSRHNLSVTGPGPIKSTTEQEICVYCHTPHRARTTTGLLWNRDDSTATYTQYQSTSLKAVVGQPTGASKLCLSCHDGTVALGELVSRPTEIPFAGGIRFLPAGETRLGTDLSDDHPVSFVYDESLAIQNGELASPSILTNTVRLDRNGELQCTACHDPHDDTLGKFLVRPNNFSELCVTCHTRTDWAFSSHATSAATWSGIGPDPWPFTEFTTVAESACRNCHTPHTAGEPLRLLNYIAEEDNCLACHNGNVASTDIEFDVLKSFTHPVQDYTRVHDATEDPTIFMPNHVECVDCHNPHRVNSNTAAAPAVGGTQLGVSGVSAAGVAVPESSFLYEICFKCHADNNVLSFVPITRQHAQINTRLEFDLANPSYHPVEGIGKNPDVPSLAGGPYSETSIIYCTDCHNSDTSTASGGPGPDGPHGSIYSPILERNYTTLDNTTESTFEYALCYKCHDRNSILGDDSFKEHDTHVRKEDAPCSTCHDPHGVSATQGNPVNNTHLINFDLNIVSPSSSGLLMFEDLGARRGQCYLTCHGKDHDPKDY